MKFTLQKLLLATCVLILISANSSSIWARNLTDRLDDLPYRARPIEHLHYFSDDYNQYECIAGDLTDDGRDELVVGIPGGFQGIGGEGISPGIIFQYTLPLDLCGMEQSPYLGGIADLNDDGHSEIIYTVKSSVDDNWWLQAYDPFHGGLSCNLELPQGPDTFTDDRWDGNHFIAGILPDVCPDGGDGLLISTVVRRDLHPRGLMLIDPLTGTILWRYQIGPNPTPYQFWIGDLDGEGSWEIVFTANSPGNMGGKLVNGTSDNESRVFVLSAQGELLWSRVTGPSFCTTLLAVGDMDGDGLSEVATATLNHGAGSGTRNRLTLWRGKTGDMIAEIVSEFPFSGLGLVPTSESESGCLVSGSTNGHLSSFVLRDQRLVVRDEVEFDGSIHVTGVGDLLPHPGTELFTAIEGIGTLILDQQLNPLALHPNRHKLGDIMPSLVWQSRFPSKYLLLRTILGREGLGFELVEQKHQNLLWLLLVPPVALLLLLGRKRITGNDTQAIENTTMDSPSEDRELLQKLLRGLEESSHGTISATRGWQRLVWLLEMHLRKEGQSKEIHNRLLSGLDDLQDIVHPRLIEIIGLAQRSRFRPELVERAAKALESSRTMILDLVDADLPLEEIRKNLPEIRSNTEIGETALKELQWALRHYFTVDAHQVTERLLNLWGEKLGELKIEYTVTDLGAGQSALCVIDGGDLRFVLENLIDNAIRAMTSSPKRHLNLRLHLQNTHLVLEIEDSGKGIPTADQERIFQAGNSTRKGGGLGLHRSREILNKWNGTLSLSRSVVDGGSLFTLQLPKGIDARGTGNADTHIKRGDEL